MHLKSLTLKGFKSFASGTTLRLEPGVTCVVGPNGSGKSNVVDAIAWVLGEQGAKSLRGGKMEDVIFAGTRSRPPLGRAEVVLTIDNSDGLLPIEYAEVTISRLMYRSGESEYAINGHRCRLLDVQELLSDSGIGRELHVIVGQGQLDAVLHAAPEDRRAYIEEAAGILKHRRRKEKALRKLAATDQNTARLTDLLAEVRRQLRPLGRQAEAARRAAGVQAELRDARARLLADDLTAASAALAASRDAEHADRERYERLKADLEHARTSVATLEAELASAVADEVSRRELAHRLERVLERFRGLVGLAAERRSHLEQSLPRRDARDPEALERSCAAARIDLADVVAAVAQARDLLSGATADRSQAEAAAATEESRYLAAVRAAADRREGAARLSEQTRAAAARRDGAAADLARLEQAVADNEAARARETDLWERLQAEAGSFDDDEADLDAAHEQALAGFEAASARLAAVRASLADARAAVASASARADALALGLRRRDATGELAAGARESGESREPGDRTPRVLGAVGELVAVTAGYEAALAAALGPAAEAVAVPGLDGVRDTVGWLHDRNGGRAGLLVVADGPGHRDAPVPPGARAVPLPGTLRLADLVLGDDPVAATIRLLLSDVVVVDDMDAALDVVRRDPHLRAVTTDGDLAGALWSAGGPAGAPSVIEVHAAHEQAGRDRDHAAAAAEQLLGEEEGCVAAVDRAAAARAEALAALNASDARIAAAEEELARRAGAVRGLEAESRRLAAAVETARHGWADASQRHDELSAALTAATHEATAPGDGEPDPTAKDAAAATAAAARGAETEARLALRAEEERHRTAEERCRRAEHALGAERRARLEEAQARARREAGAGDARDLETTAAAVVDLVTRRVAAVTERRDALGDRVRALREHLAEARGRAEAAAAEAERLAEAVHREDVARTERTLRLEELTRRVADELRMVPTDLLAEFGPDVPVPGPEPDAPGRPFDREEQEERLARAEKELARLGSVNPLALEEFAAMEERHDFLARQLDDVRTTRRDLMTVVAEVDDRIRAVFAQAFEDVAVEFEQVFAALFPGGEGRLVLTDPDDPLATGVEVEARPPGKKVKRLSLLSGGERSLTAIALLVAIFRARPSPFYVLDEVEAALDDTNLGRLVGLLDGLRLSSQLVVITHQKRTMEVADALYGVAMQGDGVSKVVSQRLRGRDPVPDQRSPSVPQPA